MEILKRIGCRVIAPLLLSVTGLLMIVVVPMNATQFLAEEESELHDSGIEPDSVYHHLKGLIYLDINNDIGQVSPETGAAENLRSR